MRKIERIIQGIKLQLSPELKKFDHLVPKIVDYLLRTNPDALAGSEMIGIRKGIEKMNELSSMLSEKEGRRVIPSPDQRIRDSEKLKKIIPEEKRSGNDSIEKLREKLFKTKKPPFPNDMNRAIEWLRKEGERGMRLTKKKKENTLHLLPIPLGVKGTLDYLFVWPETQLGLMEGRTRYLSILTGFTQDSLIMYILTGKMPVSPVYKISKEELELIYKGRPVTIGSGLPIKLEIYRSITDKESRAIFKEIQKYAEMKGSISEKHERLYWLVEKMGPVPETKIMEFWRRVLKEWNRRCDDDNYKEFQEDEKYENARTARMTYLRIVRKLAQL